MNARTAPDLTVRRTVTVKAPRAVAFEVFTSRMASWWPMASHYVGPSDCADKVEVRFVAVDAQTTQVELEHRGLETFGDQAAKMRDVLGSGNGWGGMLDQYAVVASR